MSEQSNARVFISHSSKDKNFVRKLADDLKRSGFKIWLDEIELKVGDSIVQGISDGLSDSDYLILVLSQDSVNSRWVREEWNAALMNELSGSGTIVLPAMIEDVEVPFILKQRVYADFRQDYQTGLKALLAVLEQEITTGAGVMKKGGTRGGDCVTSLAAIRLADLRRLIRSRMNRSEVKGIWFDTLDTKMDDDMHGFPLDDCIIELLDRARKR
ncbi:MAG: toll/interleukin-1 receptor domain-containing protein, partial [Blastocatellia bacterium]|nr:toll/interleukin-1 receptor domain-containing protein [Blastocatellia bacterium]